MNGFHPSKEDINFKNGVVSGDRRDEKYSPQDNAHKIGYKKCYPKMLLLAPVSERQECQRRKQHVTA